LFDSFNYVSSSKFCQQEIEKYKLGNPKSFHYLNQSQCYELADVNDAHEYLATRRAMGIVGIGHKDQVLISQAWI